MKEQTTMNLLDRLIAFVAPAWAMRRLRARAALKAATSKSAAPAGLNFYRVDRDGWTPLKIENGQMSIIPNSRPVPPPESPQRHDAAEPWVSVSPRWVRGK